MRLLPPIIAGLIALSALSWVCVRDVAGVVEADLVSRAQRALVATGLPDLEVVADGRDLTVRGTVPNPARRLAAERAVSAIDGARRVVCGLNVLTGARGGGEPGPGPTVVAPMEGLDALGDVIVADTGPTVDAGPLGGDADAVREVHGVVIVTLPIQVVAERLPNGGVRISGAAPSREARNRWVGAAARAFGADKVSLDLAVDPRDAPAMAAVLPKVIAQLRSLDEGRAELTRDVLVLRGVADNLERQGQIRGALERLVPEDFTLDILLRLPGQAPPPGWERALEAAVPLPPTAPLDLGPSRDVVEAGEVLTAGDVGPVPRLHELAATPRSDAVGGQGSGAVLDTHPTSDTGRVPSPDTSRTPSPDTNAALDTVVTMAQDAGEHGGQEASPSPGSASVAARVRACQTRVDALLADDPLHFDGLTLDRSSKRTIRKLATILRGCGEDIHANIEGHTDDNGAEAMNLKVSRRRARNVKRALVRFGVDSDRLVWEGYGESRPIATNKTAAGRAKNSRIELSLRQGSTP